MLDRRRASLETAALRPPQMRDFLNAIKDLLMLRSVACPGERPGGVLKGARLEARTTPNCSCSFAVIPDHLFCGNNDGIGGLLKLRDAFAAQPLSEMTLVCAKRVPP